MLTVGACGSTGVNAAPSVALPDIDTLTCASNATVAPGPTSLPALAQIGAKEHAPLHGQIVPSGHGNTGPEPPIEVKGATLVALAGELRAAAAVACQLRTTKDAARAGYVMSANFTQGVGTHWTNWGLIDAPFDPMRPAMLLYAPHLGRVELIGFSYWVRTADPAGPAGFSGPADKWHRHYGLCFGRSGLLEREDVRAPALCAPGEVYVNGQDMWMLHAWVVPGSANVWGTFAALNPQLCSRSVPDIERCPGLGGP
jgi:hypothetical protein